MNIEANRAMRPDIKLDNLNDKDNKEVIAAFGEKLREGAEISDDKGKQLKEELGKIAGDDKTINTEEEHKAARDKIKEMFDTIPRGTASIETGAFAKDKSNEDLNKSLNEIGMGLPKGEDDKFKDIPADKREAFEAAAKEISPKFGNKEKIDDPEEINALREKAKELLGAEPTMMKAMQGLVMAVMPPLEDEIASHKKEEGKPPAPLAAGDKLDAEGQTRNTDLLKKAGFDDKALKDSGFLDGEGKLTEDGAKLLQTMGNKFSAYDLTAILEAEKNGHKGNATDTLKDLLGKAKEGKGRDEIFGAFEVKQEDLGEFIKGKIGGDRKIDESLKPKKEE